MNLAVITSHRSTCCRRNVGCVLLDARGHVLATGYNGVAAGLPHCNEERWCPEGADPKKSAVSSPVKIEKAVGCVSAMTQAFYPHACPGAKAASGTNLDGCHAIHAEQNALLQCRDVYSIETCYTTTSPCITCVKLLMNTSCQRIVFRDEYPHQEARKIWEDSGREWKNIGEC